jgi:adenylate cyclase
MASEVNGAPEHSIGPVDAHGPAGSATVPPHDSSASPLSIATIWARIKEHKIVQWTLAYAAFAYTTLHGMEMAREAFDWPVTVSRITLLTLLLGTPIAATLAWYHGHRGRERISGSELLILTVLLGIAGTLLWRSSGKVHERGISSTSTTPSSQAPAFPSAFAPPVHSVAVLPFANFSGDAQQEYFSDGISEELINSLSHIHELEVAARTSSFSFKGQNVDVGTIARKLNVAAVLEGSVRRSGKTVRITAQLINTVNGFHMWSETYDRNLKDILAVQTEVATSVAQQLQVKLLGDEASRIEVGGTHKPEAYDAYLHGTQLMAMAAIDDVAVSRAALAAFDRAIALDPNYALAHTRRARALIHVSYGTDPSVRRGVQEQARTAAEQAVALTGCSILFARSRSSKRSNGD